MATITLSALRSAFKKKLTESKLGLADARKMGLKVLNRLEAKKLGVMPFAGFQIPYFDLDGKRLKFYRVRYLEDTRTGFASKTVSKPQRYSQPPNTGVEMYIPPLVSWSRYLSSQDAQLIITEGELKAACACKMGLPSVALGGVWSFKGTAKGEMVLPVFEQLRLKERPVYVIFDSDAMTNPQVRKAEHALCRALLDKGAQPFIVRLPELREGQKTGLDDFLVVKGADALIDLMDEAEPFARSSILHQLNLEVAYVRDPGLIIRLNTMQRMTAEAFRSHAYSTWSYPEESIDKEGKVTVKEVLAAPAWLRWRGRYEVEKVTYAPGQDTFMSDNTLNLWPGWAVTPKKGSVKLWSQLLDHVFADDKKAKHWFEQWCAYPLQHPGFKMFSSAVLWGITHGTGKSLIGYSLLRIYGKNGTEIDDQHLNSNFNEWAENKQFVMGDEITSGENKKHIGDRIRTMITRTDLRLNPKFIPSYTVPDVINYYFTSNNPDAFQLQDDDRRMFVWEVVAERMKREFYREYEQWMMRSLDGPAALFHHLLNLDLEDFDPRAEAMYTVSKGEMIEHMRSDLGHWIRNAVNHPDEVLGKNTGDLWTCTELVNLVKANGHNFPHLSASLMGRELKRARVSRPLYYPVINSPDIGSQRLIILRNRQKWLKASHSQLVDHYLKSRSTPKKERKYK